MKIKKLHASFGKLKNSELELNGGLNVVTAPNEAGKSTWCAFIRAMLYGVNSSERDKIGYLSDKTRYRPWSGAPMEGTMELSFEGRDITLQRTSQGVSPMRKFSAVYTGTGEPVGYLNGDNAGETLTGVSEQVFERTAFIRQSKIQISQAAELERRISALVSTGEEQSSYTETAETLRAWQRKLQYNKLGLIPKTKTEIDELCKKLETLESMHDDMGEMHHEIERLTEEKNRILADIEAYEKLEEQTAQKKVTDALKKEETAKNAVKQIKEKLNSISESVTQEDVIEIKAAFGTTDTLCAAYIEAGQKSAKLEQEYRAILAEKENSPFSSLEPAEVKKTAEAVSRYGAEIKAIKSKKRTPIRVFALIIAVLGALGAVLLSGNGDIVVWLSAALCVLGIILFAISFKNGSKKQEGELSKLLSSYGFGDTGLFLKEAKNYLAVSAACDEAFHKASAARESLRFSETAFRTCEKAVEDGLYKHFPKAQTREDAEKALKDTEILFNMLSQAETFAVAAREVSSALKSDYNGDLIYTAEEVAVPQKTREELKTSLAYTEDKLRAMTRSYNVLSGQAQAIGDPLILAGEIDSLKEKLSEQKEKYEALSLALDTLSDAENELQLRFAPVLSQRAGEIMSRLTEGKYEKIFFDKKFSAEAKERGESVSHTSLSLSEGTDNLLYLALRIAMCEIVLSGDEPCPIILDDALFTFDDARMATTLDFLRETAKGRQIILFSCHSREAKYFENAEDVTVLNLK